MKALHFHIMHQNLLGGGGEGGKTSHSFDSNHLIGKVLKNVLLFPKPPI